MNLRRYIYGIGLLLLVSLLTGCSKFIDDDLSDCPPGPNPPVPPVEDEYELNYELRLVTNITTEINTQLDTETEAYVADALRSHLSTIFTDYARDVDLSFYDTDNDKERLYHENPTMNASEKSYTINLPKREYLHLAAANLKDNKVVALTGDERSLTSQLATVSTDEETIDSHTTGLFTARQSMRVLENVDQTFHVKLYMANCAEALVIEPRGHTVKDIKVFATGFASQFHISDSVYTFAEKSPVVRSVKVETGGEDLCFCAVNFPSKDEEGMRTVIETDFDETELDEPCWQFIVYVTCEDGTITQTILSIPEPLNAGQFRIIKGYIGDQGEIKTNDQMVGVSVKIDWNDGGTHNVDL